VTGVVGARLDAIIVIVIGIANLLADGLAMGIGDYLSTRAEIDYKKDERRREGWEVEHYPEGEMSEMVEIYMKRGLSKEEAEQVVNIFSKHKKTWVDVMMLEELNLVENEASPKKNAVITFISFVVFGFIPLVSYIIMALIPGGSAMPAVTFVLAIIATGATLFILGAMKSRITKRRVLWSGLETLLIGGGTALLSFVVGSVLDLLIHFNI
nr:VIT1/CCC1 transporter family protein [Candidatus Sigynarchaeota archaeon]